MTLGRRVLSGSRRGARGVVQGSAAVYRFAVTRGALVVIAGWIAVALLAPRLGGGSLGVSINNLLPPKSQAVAVSKRTLKEFRVPVLAEQTVIVHEPGRLGVLPRADAYAWALSFTQSLLKGRTQVAGAGHVVAAVPVPTLKADTVVTYLYLSPGTSQGDAQVLAARYARHFRAFPGVRTYVTGLTFAEAEQQNLLTSRMLWFRILSVLVVGIIVAITFRSLVAPIVVILVAGAAYVGAEALLQLVSHVFDVTASNDMEPVIVALVLGVVTDYAMLMFQGFREPLARGLDHGAAVRETLRSAVPIVTVAALTVAAGLSTLMIADLPLFRAFGPALALSVVAGLAASITLTPALMTLLGHRLLRPTASHAGGSVSARPSWLSRLTVAAVVRRFSAAALVLVALGGLVAVGLLARHMRLGASVVATLPRNTEAAQGAAVLERAGIGGITDPTTVLVEGPRVADQRLALSRLQREIAGQPGVAEAYGPADLPVAPAEGVFYSRGGNAARIIVAFHTDPLGARAIHDLRHLQGELGGLAARAGLSHAHSSVAGDTAIASALAARSSHSLWITILAATGIEFVILALYLRALLSPIVLLACSGLTVLAALGLTTWFFQGMSGDAAVMFYIPFTAAVLLFSLGSDYNIFAVGNIWQEARRRPFTEAMRVALPRSRRAIAGAGLTLAATMAMVAVFPVESTREFAFMMGVGLTIDTLLVRPLVAPALLRLLGRAAGWPGGRIRTRKEAVT